MMFLSVLKDADKTGSSLKISRLLELHSKFESQGLTKSLGDGFLMAHNQVYKNIRQAATDAGYAFSDSRNEAYDAFPLLQLESLLAQKTIPYSNNVIAFKDLKPVQLDSISWEDIDGNIKRNFVFHEGCHGVVRTLAEKRLKPSKSGNLLEDQRREALRMLFEESCSNTAELLGCIEVNDAAHRIFYEMNSYVCEFENRTQLKNAMSEVGAGVFVPYMLLAYLHANFLRESIDEKDQAGILSFIKAPALSPKQLKTLRSAAKVTFNLSERFRYQTTGFHLRLAGIKTPMEELFDFNFIKMLEKEAGYSELLTDVQSLLSSR